jgi:hypothetical protein
MSRTAKLEVVANMSIVISGIFFCALAGYTVIAQRSAREAQRPYHRGDQFDAVRGLETRGPSPTLLLVIRSTCRFCNESVPFYRRLLDESAKRRVRAVALMFDQPEAGTAYIARTGLHVQQVVAVDGSQLTGIAGTPTLILLAKSGVVVNSWVGKLTADTETEVIEAVRRSG